MKVWRNESVNSTLPRLLPLIGKVNYEAMAGLPRRVAIIPPFSHTSCISHTRELRGWLINYHIEAHDHFSDKTS